jgi:hypothetical protein|tara:strand:+ start:26552 stop:26941 length:390 start_codon:yes stop_codon:yes gene_type:complete
MFEDLNEDNVSLYSMKSYDNPHCHTVEEFMDDMKRVKYIKRLFYRYHTKGILKERLVLNHLIVLYNVLGQEACTRILFLKTDKVQHYILKSFLVFLHRLPDIVHGVKGRDISTQGINLDENILSVLREI